MNHTEQEMSLWIFKKEKLQQFVFSVRRLNSSLVRYQREGNARTKPSQVYTQKTNVIFLHFTLLIDYLVNNIVVLSRGVGGSRD